MVSMQSSDCFSRDSIPHIDIFKYINNLFKRWSVITGVSKNEEQKEQTIDYQQDTISRYRAR